MLQRILLFGLALELATSFDNSDLKTWLATVQMDGDKCIYRNYTFALYYNPKEACEDWTCNKREKTVSVVGCSDPPTGCIRNASSDAAFPECCEKSCVRLTDATCTTPNNILLADGQAYNSTDPCVRYECNNKTITTVRCSEPPPGCTRDSTRSSYGYPTCCEIRCVKTASPPEALANKPG
uniref:Single domain-containing protein n=1 Tax=Amblyomma maculatum TaxID=34609 RepID=G3MTA9_AMBMU